MILITRRTPEETGAEMVVRSRPDYASLPGEALAAGAASLAIVPERCHTSESSLAQIAAMLRADERCEDIAVWLCVEGPVRRTIDLFPEDPADIAPAENARSALRRRVSLPFGPGRRAGKTAFSEAARPAPDAFGMTAAAAGPFCAKAPACEESVLLCEECADAEIMPDFTSGLDESFAEMLIRKLNERDMTNAQCYRRANLDRRLFSKIIGGQGYRPGKETATAIGLALRLPLPELQEFVGRAGFTLSGAILADKIVLYYVSRGDYDIDHINTALFAYDQRLLGGCA